MDAMKCDTSLFLLPVHSLYTVCTVVFDDCVCRIRRRAGDKQYHSDDGYTSDPGIIREEEDDDETDENTETTDGTDVSSPHVHTCIISPA